MERKEKAIALIANAIAVYSIHNERGNIPQNSSMIDFILKSIPKDLKSEVSIELIDDVFEFVSGTHLELS